MQKVYKQLTRAHFSTFATENEKLAEDVLNEDMLHRMTC